MIGPEDPHWILVLKPFNEIKALSEVFLIILSMALVVTAVSWNDYRWQDGQLTIKDGSIGSWIFVFLLALSVLGLIMVYVYFRLVRSVAIDENTLFVRRFQNRISRYPWNGIRILYYVPWEKQISNSSGIPTKITTISLNLGLKQYVPFTVDQKTAEIIVSRYERRTGKRAERDLAKP